MCIVMMLGVVQRASAALFNRFRRDSFVSDEEAGGESTPTLTPNPTLTLTEDSSAVSVSDTRAVSEDTETKTVPLSNSVRVSRVI